MDFSLYTGAEATVEVDENKGFEPFKEDGVVCQVNSIDITTGDQEWNMGHQVVSIEMQVVQSKEGNINRRLWKRFDLDDERGIKNFKQSVFNVDPELANGIVDEASLEAALVTFQSLLITVNCWSPKPKEGKKPSQFSKIKGPGGIAEGGEEFTIDAADAMPGGLAF